jgi:hypothetical protein
MGDRRWRRLTEEWAGGVNSVFHFDVQGQVTKSTHAGVPWLRFIRNELGDSVHFWPFDGWDIPAGRSAIAEIYPALWNRDFEPDGRTGDQHDAYSIAKWLSQELSGCRKRIVRAVWAISCNQTSRLPNAPRLCSRDGYWASVRGANRPIPFQPRERQDSPEMVGKPRSPATGTRKVKSCCDGPIGKATITIRRSLCCAVMIAAMNMARMVRISGFVHARLAEEEPRDFLTEILTVDRLRRLSLSARTAFR